MSKHTPGPWYINRDTATSWIDEQRLSIEGGDMFIAQVDKCLAQEANAALIAAAPGLLEALENMRSAFFIAAGDRSPFAKMALSKTDAAIASAKGEKA